MAIDAVNFSANNSSIVSSQKTEDVKIQNKQNENKQIENAQKNQDLSTTPNATVNQAVSYSCQIAQNGRPIIGVNLKSKDDKTSANTLDNDNTEEKEEKNNTLGNKQTTALRGYMMASLPSDFSSSLKGIKNKSELKNDTTDTELKQGLKHKDIDSISSAIKDAAKNALEKRKSIENKINKDGNTADKINRAKAQLEKQREIKEIKQKEAKEKKDEVKAAQKRKVAEKNRSLQNNHSQDVKNNKKSSKTNKQGNSENKPTTKIELKEQHNRWFVVKSQTNADSKLTNLNEFINSQKEECPKDIGEKPKFYDYVSGSKDKEIKENHNTDTKKNRLLSFFRDMIKWNEKVDNFEQEQTFSFLENRKAEKSAELRTFNEAKTIAAKLNNQKLQTT